jgi:hypothetical protein
MNKKIIASLTILLLSACASLRSVSVAAIPQDRSKIVEAKSSSWALLGISFSNEFAEQVTTDLAAKCPNGEISGILTKYSIYHYLLILKREVTAKGYCTQVETNTVASPATIDAGNFSAPLETSTPMESE